MFQNAIVRKPSSSLKLGLTTSAYLGRPDFDLALKQHQNYIQALTDCGVEVTILPALEQYPDSCFVEDVALVTHKMALVTRPGAESRQGEVQEILPTLQAFFKHHIGSVTTPGTCDAGDILQVNNNFFIGLSERTNEYGAQQVIRQIVQQGYTGSIIPLKELFHLKSGSSYLGEDCLLVWGELINHPAFTSLKQIVIPEEESYAANCIAVNGKVLMPAGFPQTKAILASYGYTLIELDMSEFRKLDGGLSCLSLRF